MDVTALMKLESEERELRRQLSELKRKREATEGMEEIGVSAELQAAEDAQNSRMVAQRTPDPLSIDSGVLASYMDGEEQAAMFRVTVPVKQELPSIGHLPDELIVQIVGYVSIGTRSQKALATCCLTSRQWYNAAIEPLYRHPQLSQNNINLFVSIICPSYNVHVRQSPLSAFVKALDMSKITSTGSKNATARLLSRTKDQLEDFRAPKTASSVYMYSALAKCSKLKVLDLTFCSQSPPLPDLLKGISFFKSLRTLRLPRSSGFGVHHRQSAFENTWPPNLTDLTISGGIDAHFLHGVAKFPQTLTHLTIEHCPLVKKHAIVHLLKHAVQPLRNLQYFKIAHMARLGRHSLDDTLWLLPQISSLSISVDYTSDKLFEEGDRMSHDTDKLGCPSLWHTNLRTLELTNSSGDVSTPAARRGSFQPMWVEIAVRDSTPNLRVVRIAQSLGWHLEAEAEEIEILVDNLHRVAYDDWKKRKWIFANMDESEYWVENCWEKHTGVQVFVD